MRPVTSRQNSLFAAVPAAAVAMIGLLLTTPATATGLDQYPERPIKIVVPAAAGSAPDVLGRIVADKLQSKWSKRVIVENRPGNIGNIGAEAVAKAEPDGYTLLVAQPAPLAINQHVFNNLRFDPAALVPITVSTSHNDTSAHEAAALPLKADERTEARERQGSANERTRSRGRALRAGLWRGGSPS